MMSMQLRRENMFTIKYLSFIHTILHTMYPFCEVPVPVRPDPLVKRRRYDREKQEQSWKPLYPPQTPCISRFPKSPLKQCLQSCQTALSFQFVQETFLVCSALTTTTVSHLLEARRDSPAVRLTGTHVTIRSLPSAIIHLACTLIEAGVRL